ncbi:hypothetical protein ACP275_09G127400 [Erythranthe tilingii]
MLYLIGLGLGDERDITLRGLEAVKKCSKILHGGLHFSPPLWSHLRWPFNTRKKVYAKPIVVADREMEDDMLLEAQVSDVAVLVAGDPFLERLHTLILLSEPKKLALMSKWCTMLP